MASSLQYAFFPTWYIVSDNPTVTASYKVPIYGSNYMYDQMPDNDNADHLYKEGDTAGYASIADLYKAVCDAFQFNPFTVSTFYLNDGAVAVDMITDMITSFTGSYEVRNGNYNGWNPDPALRPLGPNDLIGYCPLGIGVRGTNAFTGAGFDGKGQFVSRITTYQQYSANDGVMLEFNIWPATAIEDGFINLNRLFKDGGQYVWMKAKLYIYFRENKYYWRIMLRCVHAVGGESGWMDLKLGNYELDHVYQPDNPYDDHQADGNEGGNGGFDNDSDPTPIPDLPSVDITALGGLKLYKCTNADIAALFSYLNSHDPGESVLKMWQNPIQAVLACYILPYPVTAAGSGSISVLGMDTGVTAFTAKQWQQWNLGSVFVDYSCGNCFLDFEPYSQCSIYLPFIGIRRLNMDEVVGKTVGVIYQFDNTSGACVAYITVGGSVKYSYSGSCAVGIPLTQQNWGQFYISAATAAAGMLAGGIGAGFAAAGAVGGTSKAMAAGAALKSGIEGGGGLSSLSAKPTISRSGSISGAASALAYPAPYLIIEYPEKAKVANPAPVTGLTCGRTLSLGSLSGYNVIEHVHLHGIAATGEELDEIERLLYEGAMF